MTQPEIPGMTLANITGILGVSLILLAYFLNLFGKISQKNLKYIWMNFIGALLACYSSYLIYSIPFMVLEGTWATVSAVALFKQYIFKNQIN